MATDKECKCLKNIARTVMSASDLETYGMIMKHHGDLKFENKVIVPPEDRLSKLINRSAKILKKDLEEIDKTCIIPSEVEGRYNSGKAALEDTIKTEGKNPDIASYAGAYINDAIQDAATLRKLIPCEPEPRT